MSQSNGNGTSAYRTQANNTDVSGAHLSSKVISRDPLRTWFATTIFVELSGSLMCFILLLVIAVQKKFKGTSVLICHLLLLEGLLCGLFFPSNWITTFMRQSQVDFNFNCTTMYFMTVVTVHVENWTGVFLALNRFIAINFPHSYKPWTSKWIIGSMIILCWTISLGNNLPLYLGVGGSFAPTPPFNLCVTSLHDKVNGTVFMAVGTYLPMSLTGAIYVVVLIKMLFRYLGPRFRPVGVGPVPDQTTQVVLKRRFALARMLFMAFLWHCVCYLPSALLVILNPAVYFSDILLRYWLNALYGFGYAANPVIFLALNVDYQKGLRQFCGRGRDTRKINQESQTPDPKATAATN